MWGCGSSGVMVDGLRLISHSYCFGDSIRANVSGEHVARQTVSPLEELEKREGFDT